jgi:hypothetical protein
VCIFGTLKSKEQIGAFSTEDKWPAVTCRPEEKYDCRKGDDIKLKNKSSVSLAQDVIRDYIRRQ